MEQKSNEFVEYFKQFNTFSTADITDYYRKKQPDLKKSTINWRVYNLVNKQIITRVSKGLFSLNEVKSFVPKLDKSLINIARKIKKQFPFIDFCVWDTSVINTFAQHLSNRSFVVIEVEKDAAESVFYYLKDNIKNIYYNPSKNIIDNYMFQNSGKHYILKNLLTESPIIKTYNIETASIEKILVDTYCDTNLFEQYQGYEMNTIYKNCFNIYDINIKRLLRYASRRGKSAEIEEIIKPIICNI